MKSLSDQIVSAIKKYNAEVEEVVQKEFQKTAKETVSELKETSPVRTGEYARGWRSNKRKNKYIFSNRTKPGLTHLLENGHVSRSGKRVAPIPHIQPEYEKVLDVVERIRKKFL